MQPGFLAGRLGLPVLPHQPASLEKRAGSLGGHAPRIGAAQGKGRQFRTDFSEERGQTYLREKLRHRLADLRVGGTQQLLRLRARPGGVPATRMAIPPALPAAGRRAAQFRAADRSGIAPQQNAKLIFRLAKSVRRTDGVADGRVRQGGFGAGCFQVRCGAAFQPPREDFQTFAKRIGRALDDFHLLIQLQQAEIIRGHVAQQAQPDAAPRFLRGQKLRAGGFVEPADAAPQVHFPERVECGNR